MKKLQLWLCLISLLIFTNSCGILNNLDEISPRGEEEQTFSVKNFDKLEMGSAFKITVTKGSGYKVTAIGDARDLDDLDVSVNNKGTLKVRYRNNNYWWSIKRYQMKIEIEMPSITKADFSGASVAEIGSFGQLKNFDLVLSGANKTKIYSKINNLSINISGASTLRTYEKIDNLVVDSSGASDIDALDSDLKTADLVLSGASKVQLAVSDNLKVDASGASVVKYKGDPKIEKSLSGSSKVTKL